MPNTNYIRGRVYEYEIVKQAKEAGASIVMRASGSHGVYDVFAYFPESQKAVLWQCKTKVGEHKAEVETSEYHNFPIKIMYGIKTTKYIHRRK